MRGCGRFSGFWRGSKTLAALLIVCGLGFGVAGCAADQTTRAFRSGSEGTAAGASEPSNLDPESGSSSVSLGAQGEADVEGAGAGRQEMWFETEPDDPWEKYVWRSQRFVNDPIEIPVFTAEDGVSEFFTGKRNYCTKRLKERLVEVGFLSTEEESGELVRACTFSEADPPEGKHPAGPISIVHYAFDADGFKDLGGGRYLLQPLGDTVCHVKLEEDSNVWVGFGNTLNGGTFDHYCMRAEQVSLVIENMKGRS